MRKSAPRWRLLQLLLLLLRLLVGSWLMTPSHGAVKKVETPSLQPRVPSSSIVEQIALQVVQVPTTAPDATSSSHWSSSSSLPTMEIQIQTIPTTSTTSHVLFHGFCVLNNRHNVTVQANGSLIVPLDDDEVLRMRPSSHDSSWQMTFACDVVVASTGEHIVQAGVVATKPLVSVAPSIITLPAPVSPPGLKAGAYTYQKDAFLVFSTDKPARIGSIISITLQAPELITQGFKGNCTVNDVPGLDLLVSKDLAFYMAQYVVAEGDRSIRNGSQSTLPVQCLLVNANATSATGNNYLTVAQNAPLGFEIDAQRPQVTSTSVVFASDRPAYEGSIIEIQFHLQDDEPGLQVLNDQCAVNNVSVAESFSQATARSFLVTYVVGANDLPWKAGELPVNCSLQDQAGNVVRVDKFTDGNSLAARELKPQEIDSDALIHMSYFPDKLLLISFGIVALASHSISKVCPYVGLPRITGYLVTGILVGPYVLNFISFEQIRRLRVLDETSLAYIGLTAGSKLHWQQMKPMLKSILWITLALTVFEFGVGTLVVASLAKYIDFLRETSRSETTAIAVLAGCMMIARSPSSALAVIEEIRATGHFTTLIFAVTVTCDIVVIGLFNVFSVVAEAILSQENMSANRLGQLAIQLCVSVGVGLLTGKLLAIVILWRHTHIKRKSIWFGAQQVLKQTLILLYGLSVFMTGHVMHPYLEPLLCCMVAGATMWNSSANPEELAMLLKKMADLVYVCFFTVTGATLELNMVVKAMVLSLVLCATRIVAIFAGSWTGGFVAGEDRKHCRVSWMAYITQAGVTLGLAKQIQLLYPGWGSYFSTMIVAVVIYNQLLGPPLLRIVLHYVGDARKVEIGKVDGMKALVIGDHHSASVVDHMESCGWKISRMFFNTNPIEHEEIDQIDGVFEQNEPVDAVVVMMQSDLESFQVIRALAASCHRMKRIAVLRVVVYVIGKDAPNGQWATRFADMPQKEEHGDAIDVVVVNENEATDMLIELAACGKVVNIAPDDEDPSGSASSEPKANVQSANTSARRQSLRHKLQTMSMI